MPFLGLPAVFAVLLSLVVPGRLTQAPADIADRAEAAFASGDLTAAVADYDRLAALVPSVAPELWQRGVALYYLGRYTDCVAQFVAFNKVHPSDLEAAAWHFLCLARSQSVERARATTLRAGPDRRIMRNEVYDMFLGKITPAELVAEADKSISTAQFYAHLYAGLYYEVTGDRRAALEQISAAAADELRDEGGFMNVVARVHLGILQRGQPAAPAGAARD